MSPELRRDSHSASQLARVNDPMSTLFVPYTPFLTTARHGTDQTNTKKRAMDHRNKGGVITDCNGRRNRKKKRHQPVVVRETIKGRSPCTGNETKGRSHAVLST